MEIDLLRDPIWQFAGVLIALVMGVLALVFPRQRKKIKSLAYEIISNTPIVNVQGGIPEKMQVFYETRQIKNLNALVFRVLNNGNEPVLSKDYETPITIQFEENSEVLEVEKIDAIPQDLQPQTDKDKNQVILHPTLLNEKDHITLKILLSNAAAGTPPTVSARIAGVKQILNIGSNNPSAQQSAMIELGAVASAAFMAGFTLLMGAVMFILSEFLGAILFFIIAFIASGLVLIMFIDARSRTKKPSHPKT